MLMKKTKKVILDVADDIQENYVEDYFECQDWMEVQVEKNGLKILKYRLLLFLTQEEDFLTS